MKPQKFDYVRAHSVEQALAQLAAGQAQLLAGGQSLAPALALRMAAPGRLVDLNGIADLRGLSLSAQGTLAAGAMTRHRDFERSTLAHGALPFLRHAMAGVAHVSIRNRGTIGGSLSHADPAADWPALCLACDASMHLRSLQGERSIKAEDFGVGLFETALAPGEMLVAIDFPAWPAGRRFGLQKKARRLGDFAIVGVVCLIDTDAQGRCAAARIVLQGVSDKPVIAHAAQALLIGQAPSPELLKAAARAAQDGLEPGSDLHASSEYRLELVAALTRRALEQAFASPESAKP